MNGMNLIAEKLYDVLDDEYLNSIQNEKLMKVGNSTDETIVSRKQSASDLQSRLKTRKLLGVGELAGDNGDVYKSKISQLLGINESLYVRLPRGMFVWNTLNSFYFIILGAICLFLPRYGFLLDQGISEVPNEAIVIIRYYVAVATHGNVKWWNGLLRTVAILGNLFYHAFVDGQGGLHRQLIRVIEDSSFLTSSPILEKKSNVGVLDTFADKLENFEENKKID